MPRFFRRLADGVFDEADLRLRAQELAGFVTAAAASYHFEASRVMAVGYSNGANIAAAILLLHPTVLCGAVLFRPMVPLEPDSLPDLAGLRILVLAGRGDPIVPAENTARLVALLRRAGAEVSENRVGQGHGLGAAEIEAAQAWLVHTLWHSPAGSEEA